MASSSKPMSFDGKEQSEYEEQVEPLSEIQWRRKGGCLLFVRRKTPWKKNGCECKISRKCYIILEQKMVV